MLTDTLGLVTIDVTIDILEVNDAVAMDTVEVILGNSVSMTVVVVVSYTDVLKVRL